MATRTKNIVLFGQAGAGKSSLVNLMAGEDVADTSNDMESCTLHWQQYPIQFDSESYMVFDTVGLDEPQLDITKYLDAVENAYSLIQNLEKQGGIDLLLFCMRAGRLTETLRNNYRLFHEFLCDKKVPIVVAITYLETEPIMEAWWGRNERTFRSQQMHVVGHACITTKNNFNFQSLYEESRVIVRNLVTQCTADGQRQPWMGGNNIFVSLMRRLKQLLVGNSRVKKDIIPRLKRCGMSPDLAKKLARRIDQGVVEGTT
ncbi:P-loop containing nucleoside triphosphate hydrolase protein [Suillus subalutaceus]|uniref:P-loop containing nucleoside triphosphate hydrolase protein n=1 Tax=Suillus subalutaceus TaxID=48586 RepID=UPI001B86D99D|nr:P-loop containing nucleoside triphosphate hydrolase protein [Suillus subalutaceus]KAG1859570.1 P-loop containing nucleoside triphosphate hydrolase protein [Suillus subalutaceus]